MNLGRPRASFSFEFQFGSEIRHRASFTWFWVSLEKRDAAEETQVAVRRQLERERRSCEQLPTANSPALRGEEHPQPRADTAAVSNGDTQQPGSAPGAWCSLAKSVCL